MDKWVDDRYLKQIFETVSNDSEWFGYYNYDVINSDGTKMLCGRASFDSRAIAESDQIELGCYDICDGRWEHIGYTSAFNWQQGSMLQWVPNLHNTVIYNDVSDQKDHYVSRIVSLDSLNERVVDYPVYCITPNGKNSISLNYERSYWCRAYHYQPIKNERLNVQIDHEDGIFCVDLDNNSRKRIIEIDDVINIDSDPDFNKAKHWFEHIMISPSGKRFAFLHRYSFESGYTTRLCICNIDGSGLQVISGWRNNKWSHFGWITDDSFAIYTVKQGAVEVAYNKQVSKETNKETMASLIRKTLRLIVPKKIKKRFQSNNRMYQVFTCTEGQFKYKYDLSGDYLDIDGHPSFTNNGNYMITDSYPDSEGYQRLVILNLKNKKRILVARFYAPLKDNPASCDLHPKLCFNNKYLAVDTAYSGKHKMLLFEIKWDAVEKSLF